MKRRIKKLSEEVIHENSWWTYKHDRFEKPDGETGDYYYGVERGMAMVIPLLPNGKMALTLQHRYLEDKQSIEFPAGGIQEGESAMDAARRELLEETGWAAEDFVYLGNFQAMNSFFRSPAHVFLCSLTDQKEQRLDDTEDEDIELLDRTPQEFEDMVEKNEIWDGQTLSAWALARHHLLSSI